MADHRRKQYSRSGFLQALSQDKLSAGMYLTVCVVISLLVGAAMGLLLNSSYFRAAQALQVLVFLSLGWQHVKLFPKKAPAIYEVGVSARILFTGLTCVLIVAGLLLYYQFTFSGLTILAIASGCAFMLPIVVLEAFSTLNEIPEKLYQPWFIEDDENDSLSIFLNSFQVEVSLTAKYFDINETSYELTIPPQTPFGKLFNKFINAQLRVLPGAIQVVDERGNPYGWLFYTDRLGGLQRKYIDPRLSLRNNRIRKRVRIIAKRVSTKQHAELPANAEINKTFIPPNTK